jgi:hypothetical protein
MLRFDDCVCGTSTTGTGTLSLAATPTPPGGVDFDVWARATGVGFGNSAALLVDYTLTEYTDTTFSTEKQKEWGVGTLTLGSSSGIANATLARTTIMGTATSLNSQPATVTLSSPSAITLSTAANVLVDIAPRASAMPAHSPYYNTSGSDSNWGVCPDTIQGSATTGANFWPNSNTDWYVPSRVSVPMLVKRVTFRCSYYSSPTGTPVIYARIYEINASGQPGKLLYDFTPSSGITVSGTGNVASGASGNGFMLMPGDYLMDIALTGVTNSSSVRLLGAWEGYINIAQGRLGVTSGQGVSYATATGATAGAGPDPANTTGWTLVSNSSLIPVFGLSPS